MTHFDSEPLADFMTRHFRLKGNLILSVIS